jgi:hypothetical protein
VSIGIVVAALLSLAAALAWRRLSASRRPPGSEPWIPSALRGAELAWAEQAFRSRCRHLVARVDRAYRHGGEVVLVEDAESRWRTPHEVELLDGENLAALVQRYRLLRSDRLPEAEPAPRPSMCRHCSHRDRC